MSNLAVDTAPRGSFYPDVTQMDRVELIAYIAKAWIGGSPHARRWLSELARNA